REGSAPVDRLPQIVVQYPDRVRVLRVGIDVHVVPRPGAEFGLVVDLLPGVTAVVGTEQRAVVGFDQRPDSPLFGRGDRHTDLAEHALWQPGIAGDLGPGVAAVG